MGWYDDDGRHYETWEEFYYARELRKPVPDFGPALFVPTKERLINVAKEAASLIKGEPVAELMEYVMEHYEGKECYELCPHMIGHEYLEDARLKAAGYDDMNEHDQARFRARDYRYGQLHLELVHKYNGVRNIPKHELDRRDAVMNTPLDQVPEEWL